MIKIIESDNELFKRFENSYDWKMTLQDLKEEDPETYEYDLSVANYFNVSPSDVYVYTSEDINDYDLFREVFDSLVDAFREEYGDFEIENDNIYMVDKYKSAFAINSGLYVIYIVE